MTGWLLPGEVSGGRRSARDRLVDATMILLAAGTGALILGDTWSQHADAVKVLDLVLGVAGVGALAWRRRRPDAIGIGVGIASVVAGLAAGAALLAAFNVAVRGSCRGIVAVALISVPATVLFPALYPPDDGYLLNVFIGVLLTAVVFGWGLLVRERRVQLAGVRTQAREAERRRIAREMHDVLAHRLSLISLHAGALEYRGVEAAGVIRSAARDGLEELRDVIGLLRDGDAGAAREPEPPQPTLADVDALIEDCRAAGMDVALTLDAAGAVAPASGRTAYRIIQEGLTNARKHAPGASVAVAVTRTDGALLVDVHCRRPVGVAAALPSAGAGLLGLAERVSVAGGRLEHGPDAAGDFLLRAELPWSGS